MGNPKDKESDSGTTEASASTESTTKDARDAWYAAVISAGRGKPGMLP